MLFYCQPVYYENFNSFFTRALRSECRPIISDSTIITSPVDGEISQIGKIEHHDILQAKCHKYKRG